MVIKTHLRCNGTVEGNTLRQPGRNLSSAKNSKGNVQWYICGTGAKAAGFRPQQWVVKVDGIWYLRTVGPSGQRGQYRRTTTEWTTEVVAATPDQISRLETATVQ